MSIERSVQLPIMMPPTWWLPTTARASAALRTPTMSSWASLSRVDMAASMAEPLPQAGGAGAAGGLSGPESGVTVADSAAPTSLGGAAVVVRCAVVEQPARSTGTAASAAAVRTENRRVGIRPCCHERRTRAAATPDLRPNISASNGVGRGVHRPC